MLGRPRALAVASALVMGAAWLTEAAPAGASEAVLVKLRREGPHALRACAEVLTRNGHDLAPATADGSDSLDVLRRRLGVRRIRAIFRRAEERDLGAAERALRRRFDRARVATPRRRLHTRAGPSPPAFDAAELVHLYRFELPAGANTVAAAAELAADPHVEYAQPDFPLALDRSLDDPFLATQGSWGQPFADLWGLHRIGAPAAWDRTLGEGVVVAVVDTGIDTGHPDLVGNLWLNPGEDLDGDGVADPEEFDGVDDDGNGFVDDLYGFDFDGEGDGNGDGDLDDPEDRLDPDPFDENGHGTHVAGTVAARGDNGIGVAGVAPRARVMAVKIFPKRGSAETERAWRGVLYAAENGADVINASWSCSPRCPENPIGEEVVRLVHDLGVVFVTSAGNRADDASLTSPEKLRETLTVGAVAPDAALAPFSSFGLIVDVVAPGLDILSLRIADPPFVSPNQFVGDAYMFLNGTSMAAPHVAGVVALLLSENPGLDVEGVRAQLRRTAEDLGDAGPDRRFGHGLVRADRALLVAAPPDARVSFASPGPGEALAGDRAVEIRTRASGDALAAIRLDLGNGHEPDSWGTLAVPGAGDDLILWDAASGPDALFTLRLVATTRDGEEIQEFAPVHLDRNTPAFVSPTGRPARDPDIAGRRVVWAAPRGDGDSEDTDLDLQLGRFGIEDVLWLPRAEGDQLAPLLSRDALAWQHRPPDAGFGDRDGLFGCRLFRRATRCSPFGVATSPTATRSPPALSGRRIVYAEVVDGVSELMHCQLTTRGCTPRPVTPPAARFSHPLVDGARVIWVDQEDDGTQVLMTCRVPESGRCTPLATTVSSSLHLVPKALSRDLLVYEDAVFRPGLQLDFRLRACRLDTGTGDCPAADIVVGPSAVAVDASDDRVVWSMRRTSDQPDVMACRFDAEDLRCVPQRVTHQPARQAEPRIDGHRVVWEDERHGERGIASFALPTLARLRDREVTAGQRLTFWLREISGGGAVAFAGETANGQPLDSLGLRIRPLGMGRARVEWRPRADQVGEHRLRFRAVRPGGLYDERSLTIEVRKRRDIAAGP